MDDYGHHPTAINATLKSLREFHPGRRLVVDFIPHTYSRTEALLDEFAGCFADAEVLLLHPVYASAREIYRGGVTGRDLWELAAYLRDGKMTLYCEDLDAAAAQLMSILRPGDLFLTMGAGNNRPLGFRVLKELSR
jgi:UDP-N-acetylmuramate--alanine ligase